MLYDAIIMLLPEGFEGRSAAARSGYQPVMKVDDEFTSCKLLAKDKSCEIFELGKVYSVSIEFVFEAMYGSRLFRQKQLLFFEPPRLIGFGVFCNSGVIPEK